jgi:hypothetical protein
MMRRIRLIGWLALALLPRTPAAHPQGRTSVSAQAKPPTMARNGACPLRVARRQGALAHGRGRGRLSLTGRGPRHAERGDVLRDPRRNLGRIRRIAGALANAGADEDHAVDDGGGRR